MAKALATGPLKFKEGTEVICFFSSGFDPAVPRRAVVRGGFRSQYDGETVVVETPSGRAHIRAGRCHTFTQELWDACLNYQKKVDQLSELHKKLVAGKIPPELLQGSLLSL